MRMRLLLCALLLVGPALLLAGCRCCPDSADEAGLPTRVHMGEAPPAR